VASEINFRQIFRAGEGKAVLLLFPKKKSFKMGAVSF